MSSSTKTVESGAFDGARLQVKRKHSIFRTMLVTYQSEAKEGAPKASAAKAAGPATPERAGRKKGDRHPA